MSDQERLIAFLEGAGLPYIVEPRADINLLPVQTEEIFYVKYATRVDVSQIFEKDILFAADGHLIGVARHKPDMTPACSEFRPQVVSGLEVCETCGWSESKHAGGAS
jgi:hypothetical protein